MEESTSDYNNALMKPMTMAELLPGLSAILSKDTMRSMTSTKKPRSTMAVTRTTEKVFKPLTMAEMTAELKAIKMSSVKKKVGQAATSNKKLKMWNSSVKVENKKISHTANGEMKHNAVRKVLNFQQRPVTFVKAPQNNPAPRMTMIAETPKFHKPEYRAKKSLVLQAKPTVRISGVYNIVETPKETLKPTSRQTLKITNKENLPLKSNITRKSLAPPKLLSHKKVMPPVPDTPMSNDSWKSNGDASFLQKEKEIQDVEDKSKALSQEQAEITMKGTPPVSTPFKDYRNVQEYFNNSSDMETSTIYHDNTIMCFDKPTVNQNENEKREESVIVSLCDLLHKAKVTNTDKSNPVLDDLQEVEKQTENNIQMIENGIQILINIKESHIKSLEHVRKLMNEKKNGKTKSESEKENTVGHEAKTTPKPVLCPEKSQILACSVIKSPTYRIPNKKNLCLRKKVIHKSMPNISSLQTPNRSGGNKVLNIYMKMKEQMNFLNTPVHKPMRVPDTPAVTSHNLQMQLDKLYNGS